jgi:hypothetical protein
MPKDVKAIVPPFAAALAVALVLTLALAAQAIGKTGSVKWVCDVPGEGTVTFVSAPEAARHGITQANSRAGVVFHDQFGETCHVE